MQHSPLASFGPLNLVKTENLIWHVTAMGVLTYLMFHQWQMFEVLSSDRQIPSLCQTDCAFHCVLCNVHPENSPGFSKILNFELWARLIYQQHIKSKLTTIPSWSWRRYTKWSYWLQVWSVTTSRSNCMYGDCFKSYTNLSNLQAQFSCSCTYPSGWDMLNLSQSAIGRYSSSCTKSWQNCATRSNNYSVC